MERLLIVRLGAMGDVVHALPAVRELRQAWPGARIDWVVEQKWAELLHASDKAERGSPQKPLVDHVWTVDTRRWRKNFLSTATWNEFGELRRGMRRADYDAVLDLQGALKSAVVARASGAARSLGFAAPREAQAAWFYRQRVNAASEHVIDKNRELAAAATGKFMQGAAPLRPADLPHDPEAKRWAEEYVGGKKVAVLNPGAGWRAKQWPAERYAEVARWLGTAGFACLINSGPGAAELALAEQVESASAGGARVLAGAGISKLIAVLRKASLFVGGDTGPMHLANALGVPVAAIFGPTDPRRNGPYFAPAIVLRNEKSKTSYSHKDADDEGLLAIPAEQVIQACQKLVHG